MNKIDSTCNIQFKGISLRRISPRRKNCQIDTACMLSQSLNDVVELTKNVSKKRMAFWEALAVNYNRHNYYRKPAEQENSKLVNLVFSKVKNPKDIHRYIVHNFAESFQNISRIFDAAKNNTNSLEFVKQINKDIFEEQRPAGNDLIPRLLESPFSSKYVKGYKDIKSYLILNKDNPDAVSGLDKMFENNTFERSVYDKKLYEQKIKDSWIFGETGVLDKQKYLENYSEPAGEIISDMYSRFLLTPEAMKAGNDKEVLNIIKTTTDENLELRLKLLENFSVSGNYDANGKNKTITGLNKLFDTVDRYKDARSFVTESMADVKNRLSLEELNEILGFVPLKSLNVFRKNALRIIYKTEGNSRIQALRDEITNPFFETEASKEHKRLALKYGYIKKDSFIKNLITKVENYFNVVRYSFAKDSEKTISLPVEPKPLNISVDAAEPVIPKPEKIDAKAVVKENVLSFVTKKLSAKTFDRQKTAYSANATKMRLGMLPEIFASVADTRKADRTVGKRKNQAYNKDVLDLYLRINGNNKKFVNYLLKKRNVDNTRMFNVKEIIAMLDKAEAKIAANKKSNPEYRARDARRYYNHLYEAKIQQYGKLTRPRNK